MCPANLPKVHFRPWIDFGSLRGEEDQVFSFPSSLVTCCHSSFRTTPTAPPSSSNVRFFIRQGSLNAWDYQIFCGGSNFMLKNRWWFGLVFQKRPKMVHLMVDFAFEVTIILGKNLGICCPGYFLRIWSHGIQSHFSPPFWEIIFGSLFPFASNNRKSPSNF